MNYKQIISASLLMALMAGCASSNKLAIRDPVGPAPFGPAEASREGTLQVFSAKEKSLSRLPAGDIPEKEEIRYESAHTDYEIYQANGELLKQVCNARNLNDPNPALVRLAAGQYKVVAEAPTGDGWTTPYAVTVVIKAGQKTVVHLEADWRPAKQQEGGYPLVQGHDGRIIGWLADN